MKKMKKSEVKNDINNDKYWSNDVLTKFAPPPFIDWCIDCYFYFCTKEVRWEGTRFGVKQWRAICVIIPTTQCFMTHAARHCFTPNALSSHLTSFLYCVQWFLSQPQSQRQALSSWLMKPIHQVTRYGLLLNAIRKKTEDPQQITALQQMINSVETFVHRINGRVRDAQESEALDRVYERITGYDVFDGSATEEVTAVSGRKKPRTTKNSHKNDSHWMSNLFVDSVLMYSTMTRKQISHIGKSVLFTTLSYSATLFIRKQIWRLRLKTFWNCIIVFIFYF